MSSLKKRSLLRTLIIAMLFITHQQNNPIAIEIFNLEPYQSYIMPCITSCCIGIIVCILFQKFCCHKPIIVQQQNPKEKEAKKQLLTQLNSKIEALQKNVDVMKEEQKKLTKLVQIQKNQINCESLELFNLHKNCLLMISFSYWHQQYKEKAKECELYKQLLHKKEIPLELTTQKTTSKDKTLTSS